MAENLRVGIQMLVIWLELCMYKSSTLQYHPLHHYCCINILYGSPFWYQVIQVILEYCYELVKECGLIPHAFADDLQIYGHSISADTQKLVTCMTTCIEQIRCWMASNSLRLNPTKTQLIIIWLSSPRRTNLLSTSPIQFQSVRDLFELSSTVICHQHMSAIKPVYASTVCISYDLFDDV